MLVLMLMLSAPRSVAVIWRVPEELTDLQQALDLAQDRDTVLVAPGVYSGHFRMLDKSLTLASWHLTDGDSSRILDTVLDGMGTGTALFVRSVGQRHPVIHGFTVRNGLGDQPSGGNSDVAGGLHLDEHSNATLRWLNFQGNRGPHWGAALVARGDWGQLRLEHVHFHDNLSLSGYASNPVAYLRTTQSVVLDHVSAVVPGETSALLHVICDSLTADHLYLRDQRQTGSGATRGSTLLKFSADRYARITDVRVENCETTAGGLCVFYGRDRLELSGVSLRDNLNNGPQGDSQEPFMLWAYGSGQTRIHQVELVGNRMPHQGTLLELDAGAPGSIEDLALLDNTLGVADTLQEYAGWVPGILALLEAGTVSGLRVEGNRRIIPALYNTQSLGFVCDGGLVDIQAPAGADTLRLQGITILDNQLEDLDYPMDFESTHRGVGLSVQSVLGQTTLLTGGRLNGNSVSRLPEPPGYWYQPAIPSLVDLQGGEFLLQDVQLLHNTIGALNASVESIRIDNLLLADPGEHGIHLLAQSVYIRNLLLQGVDQPPEVLPRFAQVLHIEEALQVDLLNCTLADNRAESLLALPIGEGTQTRLVNCCLTENPVAALEDTTPGGEDAWHPASFEHCLLPVARPGAGNRVAALHGMSGPRLLREFRTGSPCVDGGDPGVEWQDRADILDPELPAPPSAGTRRNDIGHLGGPWAGVLPCVDPLPPATTLRVSRLAHRVHLDWDPVSYTNDGCPLEAVEYLVQAADDPPGPWQTLSRTTATDWSEPLQPGNGRRNYRVLVRAADTIWITGD
jgi:hypothetical protein